jgi:hypothetical protein
VIGLVCQPIALATPVGQMDAVACASSSTCLAIGETEHTSGYTFVAFRTTDGGTSWVSQDYGAPRHAWSASGGGRPATSSASSRPSATK